MATYKTLLSEKNFLKVRLRARALRLGTDLVAILYKERKLIFKTASGTYGNKVHHIQTIEITDAYLENLSKSRSYKDVEDILLNSGLRIHCTCLAKGTRILTKAGYQNIEDVNPGDLVLGSDSNWHPVVRNLKSEEKKEWVSIKARGLRDPLVVSTEHKVLFSTYRDVCACGCGLNMRSISDKVRMSAAHALYERRKFIPKHANREIADNFERYQLHAVSEYKPGELLCTPIVTGTVDFDVNYARMLGYYLAEGHIPKAGSTVVITLNMNERDTIASDIVQYFTSIGVKTRLKDNYYKDRSWLNVNIYSNKFREDCRYYCGQYSDKKAISTDVLSWNDAAKESFVIGHLLGDGNVNSHSFRWLSTSKDLIDMMQLILGSLKVHAATFIGKHELPPRHTLYGLSCPINQFYPIYSRYKHLFREKDIIENHSRGQVQVDKYVLFKITEVTKIPEPVESYDLCLLTEPHTYVANQVVVSNCPAFLYWGYKYMAWKRGYGLQREMRRPIVRNPREIGYVCFTTGTKITTPDGFKRIESIQSGDLVISHYGNSCKVSAVSSRFVIGTFVIHAGDEFIECTKDHPFLTLRESEALWIPAYDLSEGDMLLCPSEYSKSHKKHVTLNYVTYTVIPILSKTFKISRVKVFNIEVENDESYIADGVAVHNCKHLYLVMSVYPMWAKTLASKFKSWSESKDKSNLITKEAASLQDANKVTEQDKLTEEELLEESLEA